MIKVRTSTEMPKIILTNGHVRFPASDFSMYNEVLSSRFCTRYDSNLVFAKPHLFQILGLHIMRKSPNIISPEKEAYLIISLVKNLSLS
mmetsp:Transcript_29019/g.38136  ORF Transcript_29019/g.38136 Transcript_29019/m.38136 type:complete len:89 (+) Transcript_29019:177-443(+)